MGRRDRNERLLEAGLALSSELSLPVILQRIVDLAADLTGARYGALGVLGPDGTISEFITTGVSEAERAAIGHIPVGRGILGVLIEDASPLRLREIAEDPRSVGFPANHPPMRSFLGAPVSARGQVFGNLYLTEKHDAEAFTDEDERALVMLAGQAGVAIENARLYEEARDRARRLEAVREIATAILDGTDPDRVLGLVARHARELVGADLATLADPPARATWWSGPPTAFTPTSWPGRCSPSRDRSPARSFGPAGRSCWPTPPATGGCGSPPCEREGSVRP